MNFYFKLESTLSILRGYIDMCSKKQLEGRTFEQITAEKYDVHIFVMMTSFSHTVMNS